MPSDSSPDLREKVKDRAGNRCEYCLVPELFQIHKHEIDHILPRQHGGQTFLENLALACWRCNRNKGANIGSYDLKTGNFAPFYNPRTQVWTEHFRLENAEIIPLTAEAEVTVRILRLNDTTRIEERLKLIEAGVY